MGFFYGADADTVEFESGEAGADSEARYVHTIHDVKNNEFLPQQLFQKPSIIIILPQTTPKAPGGLHGGGEVRRGWLHRPRPLRSPFADGGGGGKPLRGEEECPYLDWGGGIREGTNIRVVIARTSALSPPEKNLLRGIKTNRVSCQPLSWYCATISWPNIVRKVHCRKYFPSSACFFLLNARVSGNMASSRSRWTSSTFRGEVGGWCRWRRSRPGGHSRRATIKVGIERFPL